jgi:hypothetical protein
MYDKLSDAAAFLSLLCTEAAQAAFANRMSNSNGCNSPT